MNRELVGHQLVESRVISSEDLNKALELQQWEGGRLGSILIRMGVLSESTLLEFLSQRYGVPTVELSTCTLDDTLKGLMSLELMQQHLICPVKKTASRLSVAMVDPTNSTLLDELRFRTGLHIIPMVATETAVRLALQQFHLPAGPTDMPGRDSLPGASSPRKNGHAGEKSVHATGQALDGKRSGVLSSVVAQEGSAGDVVNGLLQQAIGMDASDIHIEPLEKILRVRVRLDGELRPLTNLPKELHASLIARLKILSNMDIAERRLPQDGRMKVEAFPQVDIRVAMLPCLYGEKAVLRLLNQGGLSLHVTNLGLDQADLDLLTVALENPYGMILVTGPTGSGKTTTLYSALQFLNTPQMNIVTVEDPVEYQIQGINQLQIHEEIGLTFAAGLRAFLRQDPDVMMVGEIRDRDTAQIAIQAALTGHRVLSTLHTMNAPGAITRLVDMAIEPFLVASAVSLIIGQRLLRKICEHCREPETISPDRLVDMGFQPGDVDCVRPMKGKGCVRCHQTGFKGRMAIFEILPMYERLHELILGRASAGEIKACAQNQGFRTLRQAGLVAVQKGLTTVGEVLSETRTDLAG
ncbi:MAG: GspE/PulE family protein [Nitrospirales bacterium]